MGFKNVYNRNFVYFNKESTVSSLKFSCEDSCRFFSFITLAFLYHVEDTCCEYYQSNSMSAEKRV